VVPHLLQNRYKGDSKVRQKSTRTNVSQAYLIGTGILAVLGGVFAMGGAGFVMLVLASILAGVGALDSPTGEQRHTALMLLLFVFIISVLKFPEAHSRFDYRVRVYDSEVKSNLKNAAAAQEAYFKENSTYTNKMGSLKGFIQSANVIITMEATTTTFIITGTVKEGCSPNTGTWTFNRTTGAVGGKPCQ
jgi:Tfp pilus assembly protein PilE